MLTWKGTWDATLNFPQLSSASPDNNGWQFIVSSPGEQTINGFNQYFKTGEMIISNGQVWESVPRAVEELKVVNDLKTNDPDAALSSSQGYFLRRILPYMRPTKVHNFGKSRVVIWSAYPGDSGKYHVYTDNGGYVVVTGTSFVDVDGLSDDDDGYHVFDANNDPYKKDTGISLPVSDDGTIDQSHRAIIGAPGSSGIYIIRRGAKIGPLSIDGNGRVNLQGHKLDDENRLFLL